MAAVEKTDNGWRVTVDGRTVELLDSDYDSAEESFVGDDADGQPFSGR